MKRPSVLLLTLISLVPGTAAGFSHIVMPDESLAQIAERTYGDSRFETVLVGANALDVQGGSLLVAGMRLEIPAPSYHRVVAGETWKSLAFAWLGSRSEARATMLARANDALPWVAPTEGEEVMIPAVVTHIASESDAVPTLAKRYWGDANLSWQLNGYNDRDGAELKRGQIVLVPMPHLKLTQAGKLEAQQAAERDGAAVGGVVQDGQRRAEPELKQLLSDVRYGRYTEAVARGNRLIGIGVLTHPQLAILYKSLVEAYVALGESEAAADACSTWRKHDPTPALDPVWVAPKIRRACGAP